MKNNKNELYALEQLAIGNTLIHRLHPLVKLLSTVLFIIIVVSFNRYALGRLIPFFLFPAIIIALSDMPYSMLFKRFLIAFPFCLFAGISNVFFDKAVAFEIDGIVISFGLLSLFTILFKCYLCVMAVLILVSVTPLSELTFEMRRLKIPFVFIVIFEMTYRYIGVLLNELFLMNTAYCLRNTNRKGIEMRSLLQLRDMGSFTGQLLIRSFDRADRIYNAMKCRGYAQGYVNTQQNISHNSKRLKYNDIIYFLIVLLFCVTLRVIDVNKLYDKLFGSFM
ncbi:MAG: cobalt ECF transporter T component CbiQ [Treponema sp.]|jgi:cobalt/nickel transport system permease protein|nr:cobalt ECF transporter T component CbiQ [Treponema sp.]